MAFLEIKIYYTKLMIRSQEFCCELPDTGANRKVLFGLLRLLCRSETGKPLFTCQTLAEAFGYPDRRNIQNFLQEFWACAADLGAYGQRKRKVDATVVGSSGRRGGGEADPAGGGDRIV
jgi:hypothetical protein